MNRFRPSSLLLTASMALVLGSLTACGDSFLTENPPDIIVADNLYTDLAGFEAGLNALYAQVRIEREGQAGANDVTQMIYTTGVDNGWINWDSSAERVFNDWGSLNNSQFGHYRRVFVWLYETINAANTLINRAQNPDVDWSEIERDRVVGEARVIRAWAYRHLTYLWGDVPLVLEESSGETIRTDWTRTPVADVLRAMEEDLLFAEQHLPDVQANSGKVSKATAQHFLAELYLRMDDPARAEAKAQAVLDNPNYQLITARYGVAAGDTSGCTFLDQFVDGNVNRSDGNTEALWTVQFQFEVPGGGEGIMRRYWVNRYYNIRGLQTSAEFGGRGIGRLAITSWALDLYEPDDERGFACAVRRDYPYNNPANLPAGAELGDIYRMTHAQERPRTSIWPNTRKWDWVNPNDVAIDRQYSDQPFVRLAETYLLLAEAQLKRGNTPGAAETINALRRRANASEIGAGDVTLDFILDERSRELVTEEQRRYTLLRTGKWLERTRLYNPLASPNVADRDRLLPIPQAVIDANLTIEFPQNPGY